MENERNLTGRRNTNYFTPSEKFLFGGSESLSDAELLSLIIPRSGTRGEDALEFSNRLLKQADGLDGILEAEYNDVIKIKGVTKQKASQILALKELLRRYKNLKRRKNVKITSPKDAAELLYSDMSQMKQEILRVILLNTKNIVIEVRDVFKGSLNNSIVHPREIFEIAIAKSSASIIICHNHPSGDPSPSREDINITSRIKECGTILGIPLIDHIIIGNNKYISLKEEGLI